MPYKTLIFICAYLLGSTLTNANNAKNLKPLKQQEQLPPGAPTGGDPRVLSVSKKGQNQQNRHEKLLKDGASSNTSAPKNHSL